MPSRSATARSSSLFTTASPCASTTRLLQSSMSRRAGTERAGPDEAPRPPSQIIIWAPRYMERQNQTRLHVQEVVAPVSVQQEVTLPRSRHSVRWISLHKSQSEHVGAEGRA